MKTALILFAVLTANTLAFASNQVFRTNSPVPAELQTRIIQAIEAKCPAVKNGYLSEELTTAKVQQIDQGIRDTYYSSQINYSYLFDGQHPITYSVDVESVDYDINNPAFDRYQVLKVTAEKSVCP